MKIFSILAMVILVTAAIIGAYFYGNQAAKSTVLASADSLTEVPMAAKLELYRLRKGGVAVSTTARVGEVTPQSKEVDPGKLVLEVSESFDAANSNTRAYGVRVLITGVSGSKICFNAPAFVDSDAIDALISGIAYLEKPDVRSNMYVSYKSQGDLVDGRATGDLKFMKSGAVDGADVMLVLVEDCSVRLPPPQFAEFKALILEAKAKIEAMRTTSK